MVTSLETLRIDYFDISTLLDNLRGLPSLRVVILIYCGKLKRLPNYLGKYISPVETHIWRRRDQEVGSPPDSIHRGIPTARSWMVTP